MARKHRDMNSGVFHVYAHCVWAASQLFRDDADRMTFLRELARTTTRVSWTCMGYCLMRSHYHLILDVEHGALPKGMHALNFRYACLFNARHAMKGHAFAARYDSPRIANESQLLAVYKYVMRNPVRAGLCTDPDDWQWSSYAATVGLAPPIDFVDASTIVACLDCPSREEGIERLKRFVGEA